MYIHTYRYVVFLSGKVRITVPNSDVQAIFSSGASGLIIAVDTESSHVSTTLDEPVGILQIPTRDGRVPPSRVLYDGPC